MILVMYGPPGAGKDTYSAMLERDYGLYHFCMGAEFRAARDGDGENSDKLKEVMGKGNLAPDELAYEIAKNKLAGREDYVLNGFPRNIPQCLWFEGTIQKKIDAFIDLQVEEGVLIDRLVGPDGRGRSDDTEKVVKRRLEVFREQTQPVWKYLRARTNHIRIDGNGSVDEVYSSIREGLESLTV